MIVDAEVDGQRVDVRIADGHIVEVGERLDRSNEDVVDAAGGALIPGLHDHHLHLLAMAAAQRSVDVGPAADAAAFDDAIRVAAEHRPVGWLRVVGYDDRHGPLDRTRLDALAPGRAVRVQHRSGAAWVLSSVAIAEAGIDTTDGWVHRADEALRARWPDDGPPDLAPVGARLAELGITGVTDCTPFGDASGFDALAAAQRSGVVPQRVVVTGGPALAHVSPPPPLARGPVKVVVADDALPGPDELAHAFRLARRAGRSVAVHCVSRVGLVLALTAWEVVGPTEGDRIEHGSVIPVELVPRVAELGLTVVTQPGFVRDRGDRYLAEVEPEDRPHLYRCASLLDAGIPLGGSSDAPFGPDDPWLAIATAIGRQTRSGADLGPAERLAPRRALDLFLADPERPGGGARRIEAGAPADLCLLDAPLSTVLADPGAERVAATWIAGTAVHRLLR